MSRLLIGLAASIVLVGCTTTTIDPNTITPEPYQQIKVKEILATRIVRDGEDRVYSGQIKSEDGLAKFKNIYGIELDSVSVNFNTQMLIFGITDNISTTAFQFLKQERPRSFVLDYADMEIEIKLGGRLDKVDKGKKYSRLQVFILDRMEGIPHIRVKNFVANGLSNIYE
jgi:hypothetical protein